MKKTLITLMSLPAISLADTGSVEFTGGTNTYAEGESFGKLSLLEDMTTGKGSGAQVITFNPGVEIKATSGYTSAGDHTVSIWVETASLSSDQVLFAYYGPNTSQGVAYVWDADTQTISMGRGSWTDSSFSFAKSGANQTVTTKSLGENLSEGLTNITLAVSRLNTWGHQQADVWMNGVHIEDENLAHFFGDFQGSTTSTTYLVGAATYGTVSIANEKLTTAAEIAALAGAQLVPEPATATLSLLALAGLAARRRRS